MLQATVKFVISDSPADVTEIKYYNEYVKKTLKKSRIAPLTPSWLDHVDVSLNPDQVESEEDSDSS